MDPELQALREARLAELKNKQGGEARAGEGVQQYMAPEALERLARVALVRPERARAAEAYVQQLAARGVLRARISEQQIVEILDGMARDEQRRTETKIIFDRRGEPDRTAGTSADSDDDFFD